MERQAQPGFIDLFSDESDRYRRTRPHHPAALLAELAALSPDRALAWDSGSGSGQAAVGLAGHFDAVHASDASAAQIAEAEPHPRVHYAIEPAERCALPDGSADLVLAAQAMHWYDLDLFYAEAARVLRPGGILAAIGYSWFFVGEAIDNAVREALLRPLQPYWAPQNRILWDQYRGIPFPGEECRVGPHALHLSWSLDELLDYVRSWSAARSLVAAQGEGWLDKARAELASLWGEGRRAVVMPMAARAARLG
jgi:SAM-dependent methyltransferase